MCLLALRLLGGDVAMLQIVAWTGMLVSRTAERGVAAAVESTFDGDEPCPLCKAVKAVQQSDQKEEQPANPEGLITKLKLKDMLRADDLAALPPAAIPLLSTAPSMDAVRCGPAPSDAPPVPPPRMCAA
jgi:hypothetical protein